MGTPSKESSPTHLPDHEETDMPTIKMFAPPTRRVSQLVRLATIEEKADTLEEVESDSSPPDPSPSTANPTRQFSIISESELFATPTGSMTSLDEHHQTGHKETAV